MLDIAPLWLQRLQRRWLAWPLAVAAVLVVLMLNEAGYQQSVQALARLRERTDATVQIQFVLRRLLDAETGQRGYLLTGRRDYLSPYEEAAGDVLRALDWLDRHLAEDGPERQSLATVLRQRTQARLHTLTATLQRHEAAGGGTPAPGLLDDDNPADTEAVRQLSTQLWQAERQLIASGRQDVFTTLSTRRIGVHFCALLALTAILLVLRQSQRVDGESQRHADALLRERERLEADIQRRTEDLTELARHLQTAREDERSRLAHDLLDELGALLTTTKLNVLRLRRDLGPSAAAAEAQARLNHLSQAIDQGISLKRRIIEDLRPSSLINLGLAAALEIQARDFAELAGVTVNRQLAELTLADNAQITAYRLVQEALTNVAKYAKARCISITLRAEGTSAHLCVQDDGIGFDPQAPRRSAHGLMGMRYRVEAAGGGLHITSAPGHGTRIEATLPLAVPTAAGARTRQA
ncbi:MAG: CHASE3 domain-containing protein [Rubrivivax sp.]|nr:CHASE3 domain-containing protein [Rubrivivax sp.]